MYPEFKGTVYQSNLYHSIRCFTHNVKISSFSLENRLLNVAWNDGHVGRFPVIWLRDTSPDKNTYSVGPAMKARNLTMNEFDVNQSPEKITIDKMSNQLIITWSNEVISRFDSSWLRLRDPSSDESRRKRRNVYLFPTETWSREDIERKLRKIDYDAMMTDNQALHDFLEAVCVDGIAILKNGPKSSEAVTKIGERIGLIQSTHFGRTFIVSTKPDASNMAYASAGTLPFHTDFPSLSNPPQLQLLHMVTKAEKGGNSLFVDGFHVAEQLRREKPDVFDILTKYSMEYIEEGFDVHEGPDGKERRFDYDMVARHKVIRLDDSGRVVKIQFGNAMRSWFYDCEPEKIQDIYGAMKTFTTYCYQDRNVLKFALDEGDTVLWANTRVLHTRDAYYSKPGAAPRTLAGCYFCWDTVKSKLRVVRDLLQHPLNQPSI